MTQMFKLYDSTLIPQTQQKSPSTCRTTCTEHLLNTDRRPPESTRNTANNWVEQKGKKEREIKREGIRTGLALLGGSCERGKDPTPWEAT